MNRIECARESEMLQAVAEGRWPDRCDPDLGAHVVECGICADLIEVAVSLSNDRETMVRDARVPGSGVVWWRAQMRIRQETLRASQRTVFFVQAAVLGAGLIVAFSVLGTMPVLPHDWLGPIGRLRDGIDLGAVARAIGWSAPLFLALAAWLALVPVAVHFALTDD